MQTPGKSEIRPRSWAPALSAGGRKAPPDSDAVNGRHARNPAGPRRGCRPDVVPVRYCPGAARLSVRIHAGEGPGRSLTSVAQMEIFGKTQRAPA